MSVLRVKDGVQFTLIAPGGFRILSAIDRACEGMGLDLTITSGCDGLHSGKADPHHRGEAYDVRTHDLTVLQKQSLLNRIMATLGWDSFYGYLEDYDTVNEHIHIQVRKGRAYGDSATAAR